MQSSDTSHHDLEPRDLPGGPGKVARVINGVMLAGLSLAALVNGLDTEGLPLWRQTIDVALAVLAYLHGRWRPTPHGVWVFAGAAVMGGVITLIERGDGLAGLLTLVVFVLLPWIPGRFRRQQAELVEATRDRADRLEREQDLIAEQARLLERARIAEDVHDTVGHELALIALRAGALELSRDLGEENRRAVTRLREAAVSATDRLRETIDVLRTPREDGAPIRPPDDSVDDLVARARAAGMDVVLVTEGEAPRSRQAARGTYRVVQESLTNAARYAPGASIRIHIERGGDWSFVRVVNGRPTEEGAAPTSDVSPDGRGGTGLAALTERVRLLGGDLEAGPADGGFAVTARIPAEPGLGRRPETDGGPS